MFSILDFIDSPCIREHNKNTNFTPLEQAVLIYHSRKTTVEEKLSAWHELLDTYSETDFEHTYFGKRQFTDGTNRQIVVDTIAVYENSLKQRSCTEGVVFEATRYESDYPDTLYPHYFPTYDAAFDYITESKKRYTDDEDLAEIQTQATIRIKTFGTDASCDTIFYFDNDLRIVDLIPGNEAWVADWCCMDSVYIHIPLPFQKGDILRSIEPGKYKYGILPHTPDEPSNIDYKDSSDIMVSLDIFEPDEKYGSFSYWHASPLDLEKCPTTELPENQSILYALRELYTDNMTIGDFLNLYSNYGQEMYWKLFGNYRVKH